MEECRKNSEPARKTCPKNRILKFTQHKNMMKAPFTIYSDFESLIKKKEEKKGDKTIIVNEHIPCGFSIVTTSPYFPRNEIRYRGPDCKQKFVEMLVAERNRLLKIFDKDSHKEMELSIEQKIAHEKATTCWICGEGGFTSCKNALLKTKITKKKKPQKREFRHLDALAPFLLECGLDAKS